MRHELGSYYHGLHEEPGVVYRRPREVWEGTPDEEPKTFPFSTGGAITVPETPEKVYIGYLCRQGHFQLDGDPEGDQCQLKNVGNVYVEFEHGFTDEEAQMYVQDALDSWNRKLTFWRES